MYQMKTETICRDCSICSSIQSSTQKLFIFAVLEKEQP